MCIFRPTSQSGFLDRITYQIPNLPYCASEAVTLRTTGKRQNTARTALSHRTEMCASRMKVDWFTKPVSSGLAKDIVHLLMLLALALLGPFVVIFQESSQAWEPIEPTISLFSSVLWASTVVNNPEVYAEQVTFVLLPVLASPALLAIAAFRVWFAFSVFAHRRGIWKTADMVMSGALMFISTMIICISVTFNSDLLGLPWGGFIPVPFGEPLSSVCYPFPVLYLAGLLCCTRRRQHPQSTQQADSR